MDYKNFTAEDEERLLAELREKITPEFMETLRLAALAIGWTCDYSEVSQFVEILGEKVGIPVKTFNPESWPHDQS